jgi:hypothetical protein
VSAAIWYIDVVDDQGDVGAYGSLALDADDKPHVSYFDDTNAMLKYAIKDVGSWGPESVTDASYGGTSLALTSTGSPRVAYTLSDTLRYAAKGATLWSSEEVAGPQVGSYLSLALDAQDDGRIAYVTHPFITGPLQLGASTLWYAEATAGGWLSETVDNVGLEGYPSIAVGADGYARISYQSPQSDLKYAWDSASGWVSETVDAWGDTGAYTSLALDSEGYPHVSYYRVPAAPVIEGRQLYSETTGALRYAYMDASGWHTETVDSDGDVGQFTSIAIDSNDYAHISYYDADNGDLKYAYQDALGWHTTTVDSNGNVGLYTSLGLDDQDDPHISYYALTEEPLPGLQDHHVIEGILKYAYQASALEPTPQETLPVTVSWPGTEVDVGINRTTFCPGWHMAYSWALQNNTGSVMNNLTVTTTLPQDTWLVPTDISGSMSGSYDDTTDTVTWTAAMLQPGETVSAILTLRTLSSINDGTQLLVDFYASVDEFDDTLRYTYISEADEALCPTTDTPTPIPTDTPTATPTATETPAVTDTPTQIPTVITPTPTLTETPTGQRMYLPQIYQFYEE